MAKRGRPKKPASELKSAQVGIRMPADLKDRLVEAAKHEGRTISQEVEQRLWRSFDEREWAARFGGSETFWTLRTIADALVSIEHMAGKRWWENRWVFDQFKELFEALVIAFRPREKSTAPKVPGLTAVRAKRWGRTRAKQILREIETIACVPRAKWGISRHRSALVEASQYLVPIMTMSPNEEGMREANPDWNKNGQRKMIIHSWAVPRGKKRTGNG